MVAAKRPWRDGLVQKQSCSAPSLLRFSKGTPVGGLFDVTNAALDVALRGAEQRQVVLSNNLANVNVPGFKPQDVTFQDQLASALESGSDPSRVDQIAPRTTVDTTSMRADGNGVDVDRTNANLAENQILFDTMMAIQTKKLHSLSTLITVPADERRVLRRARHLRLGDDRRAH